MSWTTNPIAKRFRQTVGWQYSLPDSNFEKNPSLTNIKIFKNLSFIKQWLKHKRWYLLGLQQIWTNGLQIYYISALRMPKIKLRRKPRRRRIERSYANKNFAFSIDFSTKKRVNLLRTHYKRRKKLFEHAKKYTVLNKPRNFAVQSTKLHATMRFRKTTNISRLRKCWLLFLSKENKANSNLLLAELEAKKQFHKIKYINYSLNLLQNNVYGSFPWYFQEWGNLRLWQKSNVSHKDKVIN